MEPTKDIVAIDDETIILDAISRICEDNHISLDAVLDIEEAEEKLAEDRFRLIICDLMLPDKDGFYLLQQVKKKNIDIPVLIMTGFSTTENALKALYHGAIDFIPKPFTEDELIASIRSGIRYLDIIKMNQDLPCPEEYFRLGISSWVSKNNDGTVLTGITNQYAMMLECIQTISLVHTGHQLVQGLTCAKLNCGDLTHNFIAPLSGRILDYNKKLENSGDLLKTNSFDEGWIYRILPAALEDEMKYLIPCG